jgi:hypothetical protein
LYHCIFTEVEAVLKVNAGEVDSEITVGYRTKVALSLFWNFRENGETASR